MPDEITLDLVDTETVALDLTPPDEVTLNYVESTITLDVIGQVGPQGPIGPQGLAGTIDVGTVTTGDPGTDAIITNTGSPSTAVLDFTIPRGDPGEVGGFYRHVQPVPATAWLVQHNLGLRPAVTIEDTSGQIWIPSAVVHIDDNTLRVEFEFDFIGYANCS